MKATLFATFLTLSLNNILAVASTSDEIEHLLNFVAKSGCTFERNGHKYESTEARSHIQRKYNHFKNRVETAEQFIRYAATKSSMSGKEYHASCAGKTITSKDWLTTELQRYRQQNTDS